MTLSPSPLIVAQNDHGVGLITLNRPASLNAMNPEMVAALLSVLQNWQNDPAVSCIVLQSTHPKAFCAGGDIKTIYYLIQENNLEEAKRFHSTEYAICALLKDYPKPTIALGASLVMGGGMGLVMHCQYRLVTNTSLWAMPETVIGLFPDVGATHFFNRCPNFTGYLMALTGYRASAADLIYTGLATHYLNENTLPLFVEGLKQAPLEQNPQGVIDILLENLSGPPEEESPLEHFSSTISDCFSHKSAVKILTSLEEWLKNTQPPPEKKWVQSLLERLDEGSPLSICVTLAYLNRFKTRSLKDIHRMDQVLGERFFKHGDYMEGVRAKLIDKCKSPNWKLPSLKDVSDQDIEGFLKEEP